MALKKGIGIIGYGGFGEFIRTSWNAMDNARVVAVCDSDAHPQPRRRRRVLQCGRGYPRR